MARRNKAEPVSGETAREMKRRRSKERREARKSKRSGSDTSTTTKSTSPTVSCVVERTLHEDQQLWSGIRARMTASKILNDHRERPWWLSIPQRAGISPSSGYFPCMSFNSRGRVYYGFLFREHRDSAHREMPGARKELTGRQEHGPLID